MEIGWYLRLSRARELEFLVGPKTRPVLHVKSLNVDAEGVPVQYGITWFNGDLIQLVMEAEGA